MRYAVLSDVHANLLALEAVVAAARRQGVDGWLCAGDVVGYGAQPNECVDLLGTLEAVTVAGNHDLAVTDRLPSARSSPLAAASWRWTREALRDDVRRRLVALPPRAQVGPVVMAHGSLDDVEEYVRSEDQGRTQLARLPAVAPAGDVLVLGHTHEAWAFAAERGTLLRQTPGSCRLSTGAHLLNPGSVGQSRDRCPDARYLLLDLAARTVSFHAAAYDLATCRDALRRAGLPPQSCHIRPVWPERVRERLRPRERLRRLPRTGDRVSRPAGQAR